MGRPPAFGTGPEYVVSSDGCWQWQGAISSEGYGRFNHTYAHRLYYERLVGPIPEEAQLDHLCRNRACCNPAHLEPVTHAENGRRGSRSKLSWPAVRAIRASDESLRTLGARFGVDPTVVSRVRNHKAWIDV